MDTKLKQIMTKLEEAVEQSASVFGDDGTLGEHFKELQAALEAGGHKSKPNDLRSGSAMKIEDLSSQADEKGFLTVAAKEALAKKSTSLIVKLDDGRFYKCIYLVARTRTDNVDVALKEICDSVNELVKDGLVHSTLTPPSSLQLARMPGEHPSCAVFCFVLVPGEEAESIEKRMKWIDHEGGTGKELGSIKTVLPEGEFFAVARVYHQFNALVSSGSNYDIPGNLFEIVQEYLRVLPRGTKFLGATKCAITDLSIPYELRFSNPLLQKVKMVELESVRDLARFDNKIEQFNLLVGVTYFGADGNKLHGPLTF